MGTQIVIKFKCPKSCDPAEFQRQLKGQKRGLNNQSISENVQNREKYTQRKLNKGSGRDPKGGEAQRILRQKSYEERILSNQKKGMSYIKAKKEADLWISTQAALHNPDQIAGGDPSIVSEMGNAAVNSSIGAQWKYKINKLDNSIKSYSKGKSIEELSKIKLNVKLEME